MKRMMITGILLTTTLLLANGPQNGKRTPPAEAITACTDKAENSTCSVTTPRGDTVAGTCTNTPDGKYFACKPTNHKPKNK